MATSAKTPRRFEDADFSKIKKSVQERVENIRETRRGIYLWGPVGSGKTYTAYAIREKLDEMKINSRVLSSPEMLDLVRDDYKHRDNYNLERLLNNRGVLIIDDLGAEKPSEWVAEMLFKLFDKRYREVLPTIITSNLDLDELSDRIGDRIPSRIAEMCDVFKLDGGDRRLEK